MYKHSELNCFLQPKIAPKNGNKLDPVIFPSPNPICEIPIETVRFSDEIAVNMPKVTDGVIKLAPNPNK